MSLCCCLCSPTASKSVMVQEAPAHKPSSLESQSSVKPAVAASRRCVGSLRLMLVVHTVVAPPQPSWPAVWLVGVAAHPHLAIGQGCGLVCTWSQQADSQNPG